jgi:hypothetical protein
MSIKKYAISHGSGEIIWGRYPVLWLHRRDSGSAEPGWREQSANDLNGHGPRVGLAPHRIPYAGAPKRSSPDASSGCLRVRQPGRQGIDCAQPSGRGGSACAPCSAELPDTGQRRFCPSRRRGQSERTTHEGSWRAAALTVPRPGLRPTRAWPESWRGPARRRRLGVEHPARRR